MCVDAQTEETSIFYKRREAILKKNVLQFRCNPVPNFIEIFNIMRLTHTPGLNLAQTAMMMLSSEDIMRMLTCSPEPDAAISEVAHGNAKVGDANVSSDILIEDWDVLFRAVAARLSASVCERLAQSPELHHDLAQVRSVVLECVEAMNQLHRALTRERQQRRLPVMEVKGEHTALMQAIAEVAGSVASCSTSLPLPLSVNSGVR